MSADPSRTATSRERYAASLMNTFGPPQLVLSRGKGVHVWDEDGNEYVDLLGGIAVNALGHAHPAWSEAVTEQLETLGHVSNFFATAPQITLAERLLDLASPPQVGEVAPGGRPGRPRASARARARARCSSPTPAPRPTRPPSSSPAAPAAPTWSRPRDPSTGAPWARSR